MKAPPAVNPRQTLRVTESGAGGLAARRQAHSDVSSAASALDDDELGERVLASEQLRRSPWAASHRIEIAGRPAFVKRLPLTSVEQAHPYATRNHFGLPTYYSYGVGSAGFGAYRELASHVRTTGWVLEGTILSFPLLHHARVMPRAPLSSQGPSPLDSYLARWNSNAAVGRYVRARNEGHHELWLVVECLPHTVGRWLPANQGAVGPVIDQLCRTISFLRAHGIVHFDAHLWNVLTDGAQVYLTDFGLLLDPEFDLSARERGFLATHSHYDYGEVIASLGSLLLGMVAALDATEQERLRAKYRIASDALPHLVLQRLVDRIDEVHLDKDLPLGREVAEAAARYRDVIVFMSTFLTTQQRNPRKDTPYDDTRLKELLDAVGILAP